MTELKVGQFWQSEDGVEVVILSIDEKLIYAAGRLEGGIGITKLSALQFKNRYPIAVFDAYDLIDKIKTKTKIENKKE